MRKKIFLLLLLLFISNDFVFGKNGNKSKLIKAFNKKHERHNKENKTRLKRTVDEEIEKLLIPEKDLTVYDHNLEERGRTTKFKPIVENEKPFWGNRGRRESASDETVPDVQLPTSNYHKNVGKIQNLHKLLLNVNEKTRRDEVESPFWGNRGRRGSDESEENDIDPFWANRGRRQDDEPFWGTRGRREEDSSFRGNRETRDDDEPFWGNRGKREEEEPFWGNRGRRETFEPFWGSRGKKKIKNRHVNKDAFEPFWGNRSKLKEKLQNEMQTSFWMSRGRESKLKHLFNGINRNRIQNLPSVIKESKSNEGRLNHQDPNTVLNDRIYVEEPHYILVERSSRSSAEEDPYFISRGKKYSNLDEAIRGRRGALEEIVKSVRNDPYYIARGKKNQQYIKIGNSSLSQDELLKTKDLVCSTIDLMLTKYEGNREKRQTKDNERERRTILKNLAQQLQIDPYYVSRGKKSVESYSGSDPFEQFVNNIEILCN
ncbi:unnamed protein product [Euphydryas editha]|uniref:Natalisin n=1 Tax=Euphydryas editha TaxID=104508 RepID=A0AAU9U7N3_EUPED|nr:unnamed protein product [Euphydryas editha]